MSENSDTLKAIGALQASVDNLVEQTKDIDTRLRNVEGSANRLKGAFIILLALGGAATAVGNFAGWLWDHMKGA